MSEFLTPEIAWAIASANVELPTWNFSESEYCTAHQASQSAFATAWFLVYTLQSRAAEYKLYRLPGKEEWYQGWFSEDGREPLIGVDAAILFDDQLLDMVKDYCK